MNWRFIFFVSVILFLGGILLPFSNKIKKERESRRIEIGLDISELMDDLKEETKIDFGETSSDRFLWRKEKEDIGGERREKVRALGVAGQSFEAKDVLERQYFLVISFLEDNKFIFDENNNFTDVAGYKRGRIACLLEKGEVKEKTERRDLKIKCGGVNKGEELFIFEEHELGFELELPESWGGCEIRRENIEEGVVVSFAFKRLNPWDIFNVYVVFQEKWDKFSETAIFAAADGKRVFGYKYPFNCSILDEFQCERSKEAEMIARSLRLLK